MFTNGNELDDRIDLIDKARALGGSSIEHKGATSRQVMERALTAAGVKDKLDAKSDEYVAALFDAHAHIAKNGMPAKRADSASARVYRQDSAEVPVDICARAREIMIEQNRARYDAVYAPAPVMTPELEADIRNDAAYGIEEQARRQQRRNNEEAYRRGTAGSTPPAPKPPAKDRW